MTTSRLSTPDHEHVFLGDDHQRNERKVWLVIALTASMMLVEIIAGTVYGSMALVADGWHMSTHAGAMLITALAYRFARRHSSNPRFSFGTGKLGDLAGFASAMVLAGAVVGALAWPTLRQFLPWAVALVLAALAWFMPLLGPVVLALMVCATTRRWRLATACALAAAWIVGSFYYQLRWPLADKALVLVGAATLLGLLAWWDGRRTGTAPEGAGSGVQNGLARRGAGLGGATGAAVWVLLGGTALTLLVANGAIWQKQNLIASGQPLYLALEPVDPRSLMEGDFMRLRFPTVDARELPLLQDWGSARPRMVVQLDDRGVATAERMYANGQSLATNERLLELTPKDGSWVVVTDAWFFKEGQAERWQQARFGEFRVLPDGRALLVGMADAALAPITP